MNITAKIPDTQNAEVLIERARSIVPALRQRAPQTLAERKLLCELISVTASVLERNISVEVA